MTNISPNYYADGLDPTTFRVEGLGLSLIPNDALGVYSGDNDNPLEYIESEAGYRLYSINDRGLEYINFVHLEHSAGSPVYLGAIVSQDRQTIYWVNNTKPLP